MMQKHYDVIVLGRSIGALTAAALLAKRDFTVLVLGQGTPPPTYRAEQLSFRRRSFSFLSATSPVWRRVVVELAQSQTFKRRTVPLDPMIQFLAARSRFDIAPDLELFSREVDREFPELRRLVDDLYAELARVNGAADTAFEHDAMWPPGTFWERRETARYAAMLPHVRAEPDADLLVEFPRAHLFRQIVDATVLFATDLSSLPPPFAVARLHGAWTRGLLMLPSGETDLEDYLVERINAHGGRCLLDERATAVVLRRGTASGVLIAGDEHPTGAEFVLTDMDGESLAALAGGQGIKKGALREWPRITSTVGRYVVSIVVHREGLPDPLGAEMFVLAPSGSASRREGASALRTPFIHVQRGELGDEGDALLVAELLLADHGAITPEEARHLVLDSIREALPFVERHLVALDSVHDGLPMWRFEDGRRRDVERAAAVGLTVRPEPMVRQLEVDPPGFIGLAGEPVRGPIERTLLVGRSVLPGLGQEGQLLAAWSAVRLVTRSDRRKERMRRDMWSKVEIG